MRKQEGLLIVEEKVDDFNRNESTYLSKNFQETEARTRFIDPLFTALGWELEQTGLNRQCWDVYREFSQRDDSSTKKPDYAFRIKEKGAPHNKYKEKFFVEAKAPWVPLTDAKPVFQAKRYAFSSHGKAPIVILTDFQEFRVFNGLERPRFENPLQGLIKELDLKYTDYSVKWDLLWANFSKEAVYDGSIDILAGKVSRSTKTLDDEFLNDIIEWRETLARNVAIRNNNLSVDEINEAVQRILDRFVFIRNLEDRNIEDENLLINLVDRQDGGDAHFYKCIVPVFRKFDIDYNGLLFKKHFSEDLEIDNKVIKDIIKSMSSQVSPFRFDIIEPEILGRIYERFLGSKIRLTEDHHAKVEEKPEVRHAGGVYYTPEYIVKYIVENTVGALLKGETAATDRNVCGTTGIPAGGGMPPEEIEKIKILDLACGSGSFLLGAFGYLIKYHQDYYSGLSKTARKKYKDDFFETPDGEIRLTLRKKGKILKNNIFGVDIDREATEVAIMSLYLKLLDEGFDKGQALLFMKGHILPDMTANVKCGNSLIGTDYFEGMLKINDEEFKKINPFDWEKEFSEILKKGGFDCVIGNPPYIRIQELKEYQPETIPYLKSKYYSALSGNIDIYVIFVEKGLSLLDKNGKLGFILPSKFFATDYGTALRKIISEKKALNKIIDFGHSQVFENATTYTCLLFLSNEPVNKMNYTKVINTSEMLKDETMSILIENDKLTDSPWIFATNTENLIAEKLLNNCVPLSMISRIGRGSSSGNDDVFMLKIKNGSFFTRQDESINIEKEILRVPIYATDFNRFSFAPDSGELIIFPYKVNNNDYELISENEIKNNFPKAYKYLYTHKKELEARKQFKTWYSFSAPRNLEVHEKAHILVPLLADRGLFCRLPLESNNYCLMASGGFSITINSECGLSPNYILGLLNSRVLFWRLRSISNIFRGGWITCTKQYVETLPIYKINFSVERDKFHYDSMVSFVDQMLSVQKDLQKSNTDQGKALLNRQIEMLNSQIDKLVYELYGLTDEEIKVVEGKE